MTHRMNRSIELLNWMTLLAVGGLVLGGADRTLGQEVLAESAAGVDIEDVEAPDEAGEEEMVPTAEGSPVDRIGQLSGMLQRLVDGEENPALLAEVRRLLGDGKDPELEVLALTVIVHRPGEEVGQAAIIQPPGSKNPGHPRSGNPRGAGRAALAAGGFAMSWYTIDGGGGTSTGDTFSLTGTIGQPDAGDLSGGTFVMHGGYIQPAAPSAPPCPWDISGDGSVNATDLAGVLGRWGPVDGVPAGDAAADFDSSGAVNAADLASLLGHWGPCPT